MYPKQGGAQFKNFDSTNINVENQKTIRVKNFGNNDNGNDRISLERRGSNFIFLTFNQYEIQNNNQIKRRACEIIIENIKCSSVYTDMIVEGSRVSSTLPSTIQTKLSEGMNSPNGNDWFIPR